MALCSLNGQFLDFKEPTGTVRVIICRLVARQSIDPSHGPMYYSWRWHCCCHFLVSLRSPLAPRWIFPCSSSFVAKPNSARCNAIWEVALENGRHKLTLRSALEVVNLCGASLELRCSTDAFTSRSSPDHRKQEIVGTVSLLRQAKSLKYIFISDFGPPLLSIL